MSFVDALVVERQLEMAHSCRWWLEKNCQILPAIMLVLQRALSRAVSRARFRRIRSTAFRLRRQQPECVEFFSPAEFITQAHQPFQHFTGTV